MTEYVKTSNLFQSLLCKEDDEIDEKINMAASKSEHESFHGSFAKRQKIDMKELDKVLKQVSTKIENSNDASECLTEVWDLNQFQVFVCILFLYVYNNLFTIGGLIFSSI